LYEQQIQELPLFILIPKWSDTLMKILNLAKKYHLIMRPISGRHSSNYINPDCYIDMQPFFREIRLQKINRLTICGGETQGVVYNFLFSGAWNEAKEKFSNFSIEKRSAKPLMSLCLEHYIEFHEKELETCQKLVLALPMGSAGSVGVSGLSS